MPQKLVWTERGPEEAEDTVRLRAGAQDEKICDL